MKQIKNEVYNVFLDCGGSNFPSQSALIILDAISNSLEYKPKKEELSDAVRSIKDKNERKALCKTIKIFIHG